MPTLRTKPPKFVSTVWFESDGASRHSPCRLRVLADDRVQLVHLKTGAVQADLSIAIYRHLLHAGLVRPLDEVPTFSNKRPRNLREGEPPSER